MERLPSTAFEDLASPLALDLTAAFSLMHEDTYGILDKAVKEGWDTETLIKEIEKML